MNTYEAWLRSADHAAKAGVIVAAAVSSLWTHAQVRYVNRNNASWAAAPPYTSWVTAATCIQDALDVCTNGDEVVVTNGIYDNGGLTYAGHNCRIVADKQVIIRSVNGPEETLIVGRGPCGATAIRCALMKEDSILEGFTLSNGHTHVEGDWRATCGGGALLLGSRFYDKPLVVNCIVANCSAADAGGGIAALSGDVSNTLVTGNSAVHGGGIYSGYMDVVIKGVYVRNNVATNGGGIYLDDVFSWLSDVRLEGNTAHYGGGVIALGGDVHHCSISGNYARVSGGGAYMRTLTYHLYGEHLVISHNAAQFGGGLFCDEKGFFSDCELLHNQAEEGGGLFVYRPTNDYYLDTERFSIHHNKATYGGGAILFKGGELIASAIVSNDGAYGGGVYLYNGGTLRQCIVAENNVRNSGLGEGGGVYMEQAGYLHDCLVARNTSDNTGGGLQLDGTGVVNNCTVVHNTASWQGGGIYNSNSSVRNSIIYYNHSGISGDNIHNTGGAQYLSSCAPLLTLPTCITDPPAFVDAAQGNYRLSYESPCIDHGSNAFVTSTYDLDGYQRIYYGVVDMGCYEFVPESACWGALLTICALVRRPRTLKGKCSRASYCDDQHDLT